MNKQSLAAKTLTPKTCPRCGQVFYHTPALATRFTYCSVSCAQQARAARTSKVNDGLCAVLSCAAPACERGWCKKHYKRWYRTGNPEDVLRPRIAITCQFCGKERRLQPSYAKKASTFCSQSCALKYRYANEQDGAFVKANKAVRQSQAFQEARAAGLRASPNKPERRLAQMLRLLGFEYNASRVVAGLIPDFIHKSEPKIVELFGDYWHRGENPSRKPAVYRKVGFQAVVIWEHELSDPAAILEKVNAL